MKRELEQICAEISTGEPATITFLMVAGNSYDYVYRPEPVAFTPIADRLEGSGNTGRLAAGLLRYTLRIPRVATLIPGVQRFQITVPEPPTFHAAIRGLRLKLFDLDANRVYTFPTQEKPDVLSEVNIREELPSTINTPAIHLVNETYPYFVEEYIRGETVKDIVQNPDHLFGALEQLRPLYTTRRKKWVQTATILEDVSTYLDQNNLEIGEQAMTTIQQYALPDRLAISQVHGDFHPENIIKTHDGSYYLLDWEASRDELVIYDFFRLFEIIYVTTGSVQTVAEMIIDTAAGGLIAKRHASDFGDISYDQQDFPPGLPLLFFLYRISQQHPDSVRDHRSYELLKTLLNNYDF